MSDVLVDMDLFNLTRENRWIENKYFCGITEKMW